MQNLEGGMHISALLYERRSGSEVQDAFENDDTESRVWVMKLQVCVTSAPEETAIASGVEMHQTLPDSPSYQLPVPSSNQTAVANEVILRILLMQGMDL